MITKTCRQNLEHQFEITEVDQKFYAEMQVPPPTLCPDCRFQRRLAFRHGRKLYSRKCDLSGKETISMYAQDVPFKVYEQTEWWSDKWNELDYGKDVDFSRPIFPQIQELFLETPHISLINTNCENSYYTNHALEQKNCYLVFGATKNEDVYYGNFVNSCTKVCDGTSVTSCELCYEGIASIGCYGCSFFMNCRNCRDCLMIEDCQNCQDCIGCFGLRNQSYCIFNQPVGKEKYLQMKQELWPLTPEKIRVLRRKLESVKVKLPHIYSHIYNSEDCTGELVFNSKNCQYAFDSKEGEDAKFISWTSKSIHTYDCTFNAPDGVEFCYEVASTVGVKNSMFTYLFWYGSDVLYSIECHNSSNLFGCVSMKRKQYCIFNKQYSKEEYEKLVPKIIKHMQETGEWGEYFPMSFSPFGYNESTAHEYFPLSKAEAAKLGAKWKEEDILNRYQGPKLYIQENIEEVKDDITREILTCETCGKNYKIVIQELRFYREMLLPVPRQCPDCRQKARLALRNPRKLWDRKCMKCGAAIQTSYALERKEIIYCEACYMKEIY